MFFLEQCCICKAIMELTQFKCFDAYLKSQNTESEPWQEHLRLHRLLYQCAACQAWHKISCWGGLCEKADHVEGFASTSVNFPLPTFSLCLFSPARFPRVQSIWTSVLTSSTASPGQVRRTRCASWPLRRSTSYGPSVKKSSMGKT